MCVPAMLCNVTVFLNSPILHISVEGRLNLRDTEIPVGRWVYVTPDPDPKAIRRFTFSSRIANRYSPVNQAKALFVVR